MLKISDLESMAAEDVFGVDHLPYGEHLEGIFLHLDGSVGQAWELSPCPCEGAGSEALDALADAVGGLIGRLAPGLHMQFILWGDSDVAPALEAYRQLSARGEDKIVDRIIDEKLRHILARRDGINGEAAEKFMPKRLRVFLTVRSFPAWPAGARVELARGYFSSKEPEAPCRKEWGRIRAEFARKTGMIESQFQALQIPFHALDGEEMTGLLYRLLNPHRSQMIVRPNASGDPIRERILFNAPRARGAGFVLDGYHTRVMSLKALPQQTFPGMFAGVGTFFDTHPQMMLVVNFIVPDQNEAVSRLKFQKTFAFIQRTSSMGDVSEEAVQKKEELSGLITEIFKNGRSVVQLRMHVVLWDKDEELLERACDGLMVQLHRAGAEGLKEEIIAPSIFLTCLPLNFDHRLEHFVRRDRRLLSDNFADMMPVYGAMRGTGTPAALYLNRRGEPVGVDLFDSPTNPHGIIVGASGAGKSFFTNDLIYQNYRLGARFFVLDKGHSYRKTCSILEGQYVHFDLKAPLTINPFFAPPTSENLAFLVEVLALMASGGDERDRLAREEKGFLQKAVLEAYVRVIGREVTLSDVVAVLQGPMGERLALRLAPFTRSGQYGKFFDGPNEFAVGRRFTVFELAELSAYPDLQLVVLLNIMFFVTQFVSDEKLRAERKFLLIDEAWQLLKMANTADFIGNAFKTFRKYRCATIAVTQEVADLLQQKSGLAILANTANKIFLKQEPSVIDQLRQELSLPPEAGALLRSVRTVKGKYSEALLMAPSSTGIVRLVPDPFLYWAATSEPRDNAYLEETRQRLGGDLLAALAHCAEVFPYGVR